MRYTGDQYANEKSQHHEGGKKKTSLQFIHGANFIKIPRTLKVLFKSLSEMAQ